MSDDEDNESSLIPDLDYDMWEGQFEFVGPSQNNVPHGLLKPPVFLAKHVNGAKKSQAHQWCEDVSDQVRSFAVFSSFMNIPSFIYANHKPHYSRYLMRHFFAY